jgi:chemotaxis protein CheX
MVDNSLMTEYVRRATAEVFSTMLGMEIEAGETRVEQSAPAVTDGVMSLIGLAGPWTGAGTISCNAAFACRLCTQLLMTEADSVNEDVLDAVGEVTNMIIGNFKTLVEEHLGPLGLSIPTVIFGRNFTSRSIGHSDWVVTPFRCEGEKFEVRVCLSPARHGGTPSHGAMFHGALVG